MPQSPDPNLVQKYCDGECSDQERAELEACMAEQPEVKNQVRQHTSFNSNLQLALRRSMGSASAPTALRAQVLAVLDQDSVPEIAGRVDSSTTRTATARESQRSGWRAVFEDPRRANMFAIAATLAIVASAVLYGIFGRSIDDVTPAQPRDVFAQAALFAEQEHGQCSSGKSQPRDGQITDVAEAVGKLRRWLDAQVVIADLSSHGYQFVSASYCSVPMAQRSAHLLYQKSMPTGSPTPMASVFIFPNLGQCGGKLCQGMESNRWYECDDGRCAHRVLRSTDGHLVYLLICCADSDVENLADSITESLKRELR